MPLEASIAFILFCQCSGRAMPMIRKPMYLEERIQPGSKWRSLLGLCEKGGPHVGKEEKKTAKKSL